MDEEKIMNLKLKLIAAAAAAVILAIAVGWMRSEAGLRRMERAVESARQQARASEEAARAAEMSAAEYKRKIEHLEGEIDAIGRIARRQDEELEKIDADVGGARRDVLRARSVRSIDANADELCGKLAELGHPC